MQEEEGTKRILKMSRACKICGSGTRVAFSKKILGRYEGVYHKCDDCGFLQLFEHDWLSEAYEGGAESLDTGLLTRNVNNAAKVASLLSILPKHGEPRYLDYGGGYGILVRLMRDRGYDFSLYDPYGKGLFVRGLRDPLAEGRSYRLITAFEVAEHLPDPVSAFRLMYAMGYGIFFSTELQPADQRLLSEWWYLSTGTGQHLSFYTREALSRIASVIGARYVTDGRGLHFFSPDRVDPMLFRLFTGTRFAAIRSSLASGKGSFTEADREAVTARHPEQNQKA
jgi:hypothetical protein